MGTGVVVEGRDGEAGSEGPCAVMWEDSTLGDERIHEDTKEGKLARTAFRKVPGQWEGERIGEEDFGDGVCSGQRQGAQMRLHEGLDHGGSWKAGWWFRASCSWTLLVSLEAAHGVTTE